MCIRDRLKSIAVVSKSIPHSSKLKERHAELVESFSIVANGWEKTVEHLKRMEERRIGIGALMLEILGGAPDEDGAKLTNYKKKIQKIVTIIDKEREKLGKPQDFKNASAWELFNAVQGYSQHWKTRKSGKLGKPSEFDRIIMAANDPMVNRTEALLFGDTVKPELLAV